MSFVPSLLFSLIGLGVPADPPAPDRPLTGVAFADYDRDGRLDALTWVPGGSLQLARNAGPDRFDDVTAAAGLADLGTVRSALFEDADGDGHADLLLVTPAGRARLLYGSRAGFFADGTEGSGLERIEGLLGARWLDLDGERGADLFAETATGSALWRSAGDGTFERVAWQGPAAPAPGMPAARAGSPAGGPPAPAAPGSTPFTGGTAPGAQLFCTPSIRDQASGSCLSVSSTPTEGMLYPLSDTFMVTPQGTVGIGTLNPTATLEVDGEVRGSYFRSTVPMGIAPFVVSSTTTVNSLSADLLDGLDSTVFSQLGPSIEGSEISNGTISSSNIAIGAVTSSNIANGTITASDIATGAVTGADIADGTITGNDVAASAITTAHIAAGTIIASDIATGAVGSIDLADGSIADLDVSSSAGIAGTKIDADFGSQDIVTTGRIGAGTTTPNTDLQVLGNATRGIAMIAPDQPSDGGNAELFLAEDDDGSAGMRIKYDGTANRLKISGKNNGETTHFEMARDSGNVGLGTSVGGERLRVSSDTDSTTTLRVTASGSNAQAIYAQADDNSAVHGQTVATEGLITVVAGVRGEGGPNGAHGVFGSVSGLSLGAAVYADGPFVASGPKLFVQPHPTDASKEVRFVCLEGNESGTYFRGTTRLIGGEATIDVPEDFRLASETDGLTVQVTPLGAPAVLYVVSKDLDRIVVRGTADVEFDYFANGVRRGYREFQTVVENRSFVPRERGVPWGTQYPDAFRRILVENGTLNPDFTPNEAMAAVRGWTLAEPVE